MTVAIFSLTVHMERQHGLISTQTHVVEEGGGGGSHICDVLPQCPEYGTLSISGVSNHSA